MKPSALPRPLIGSAIVGLVKSMEQGAGAAPAIHPTNAARASSIEVAIGELIKDPLFQDHSTEAALQQIKATKTQRTHIKHTRA